MKGITLSAVALALAALTAGQSHYRLSEPRVSRATVVSSGSSHSEHLSKGSGLGWEEANDVALGDHSRCHQEYGSRRRVRRRQAL